jgi:plasmid stabilization system protein ParE
MAVLFLPEAREDVIAARDWYESRAVGLGGESSRALETSVGLAQRNPIGFRLIAEQFRRVPLRRFPYFLVYQISGLDLIFIACFHHRRDPRALAERLTR